MRRKLTENHLDCRQVSLKGGRDACKLPAPVMSWEWYTLSCDGLVILGCLVRSKYLASEGVVNISVLGFEELYGVVTDCIRIVKR